LKANNKVPKAHQTKVVSFKTKVTAIFSQLDIPISIYAATEKDIFRKPRTGMWAELLEDYDISQGDVDLEHSIFVGDAGGREMIGSKPKDFSCSDRYLSCSFRASSILKPFIGTLPRMLVSYSTHPKSTSSKNCLGHLCNLLIRPVTYHLKLKVGDSVHNLKTMPY